MGNYILYCIYNFTAKFSRLEKTTRYLYITFLTGLVFFLFILIILLGGIFRVNLFKNEYVTNLLSKGKFTLLFGIAIPFMVVLSLIFKRKYIEGLEFTDLEKKKNNRIIWIVIVVLILFFILRKMISDYNI